MLGNVWEWTATAEGNRHVVRGGGWQDDAQHLRASARQLLEPAITGPDLGFRCAR